MDSGRDRRAVSRSAPVPRRRSRSGWSSRSPGFTRRSPSPRSPAPVSRSNEVNQNGGILGRQVELLVADSANDIAAGVHKTRELIDRDQVDFIPGNVNSAVALAMTRVTAEKRKLHIVTGGHIDEITGGRCSWNVFRICKTTTHGSQRDRRHADPEVRQQMVFSHARLRLRPRAAGGVRAQAARAMAAPGRQAFCRSARSIIRARSTTPAAFGRRSSST